TFGNAGARLQLGPSVVIDLVREPASATFRTRDALDGRALLHPYLGAAASVAAAWHGRESLHAGAFVHRGRAWGVLGERTAGKSSLLAVLHELGRPIVADDILVLDGLAALAAPRSVDLRREAAEARGSGGGSSFATYRPPSSSPAGSGSAGATRSRSRPSARASGYDGSRRS